MQKIGKKTNPNWLFEKQFKRQKKKKKSLSKKTILLFQTNSKFKKPKIKHIYTFKKLKSTLNSKVLKKIKQKLNLKKNLKTILELFREKERNKFNKKKIELKRKRI